MAQQQSIDLSEISFRAEKANDAPFLKQLYCVSRDVEIATIDWPTHMLQAFLYQQFELQTEHFKQVYDNAKFNLILYRGQKIGRIYVQRSKYKLHVIDITLLREYRNLGIGHYVLSNLVDTALQAGIGMSLRVKQFNPAKNLYVRLGFMTVKQEQDALYMERAPYFSSQSPSNTHHTLQGNSL